ncbi:hypothetical protein [Alkalihalobacillus sp. CinArs1]|uniref:hypothetical protein n=1 Tax=Alkalihalobacillus sp. CinArs1 TaxID=2995314 RepID=UPI0022DD91C9|nr:hypothetical protein [Alkalihalobacillus sp. CinArs1]
MNLRSKKLGSVLTKFLWVDIVLSTILLINIFIVRTIGVSESFLYYDSAVTVILSINFLTCIVLYLVWLYKVHNDLREMNASYPITPGGALARVMIPIYNLYGLWNVYATMAKYFKESSPAFEAGKKLAIYTPIYYFLYVITSVINSSLNMQSDYDPFTFIWVVSYIGDAVLVFMFILIVKVVTTALMNLSEEHSNQDEEENAHSL